MSAVEELDRFGEADAVLRASPLAPAGELRLLADGLSRALPAGPVEVRLVRGDDPGAAPLVDLIVAGRCAWCRVSPAEARRALLGLATVAEEIGR